MRHGSDAELDEEAVVPEDLVLPEDLLGHFGRIAHEKRASQLPRPLEVRALKRRPAALAPDAIHHRLVSGERDVRGSTAGLGDKAVRVDTECRPGLPRLVCRATVQ